MHTSHTHTYTQTRTKTSIYFLLAHNVFLEVSVHVIHGHSRWEVGTGKGGLCTCSPEATDGRRTTSRVTRPSVHLVLVAEWEKIIERTQLCRCVIMMKGESKDIKKRRTRNKSGEGGQRTPKRAPCVMLCC